MGDCFARLIAPMELGTFLDRYWVRKYVAMPRRANSFAEWVTLEDVDQFFQSAQLPAAYCNVVSDGTRVPIEEWSREVSSDRGTCVVIDNERLYQRYLDGATIILNQAQRAIPRLSEACRSLAKELGVRVWTNIYITPPHAAGLKLHSDDHEVLILQILGAKQWDIHAAGEDPRQIILEAGDLLYLPHSLAHSARSGDSTSIHVTIGMSPAYAFNVIEELASIAKDHPAFQMLVPQAEAGDRAGQEFETELLANIAVLMREKGIAGLMERRADSLQRDAAAAPRRFADLMRLADISRNTVVRLRSGVVFTSRDRDGQLEIAVAGRSVTVPVFLRDSLAQMTTGTPLRVGELRGLMSAEGKLELVKSLVRTGLLEVLNV